jgi:glycosyltransferase involved in cell wall biosynthesis
VRQVGYHGLPGYHLSRYRPMDRPLRIAQVAPPFERVPPRAYGGTERIIAELVAELDRRGHHVTTFASGDSDVPGRHVETVPEALRPIGYTGDSLPYFLSTMRQVLDHADEFDVIHSHLEWSSLLLARVSPTPTVSTFHGRLDLPWAADALRDPPAGLVAISENQASTHPEVPWTVIHNGLTLIDAPFERRRTDALCFVGRVAAEKGIVEAIEIAKKAGRPLRIAAKIGPIPPERDYNTEVFQPALKAASSDVEFLGELDQADRDQLFAESYASLMPGSWPEPFGLVAIEALACGTPVIARRIGGLPEIIRDGIDGFFGDDVDQLAFKVDGVDRLDREEIRRSVLERFSAGRMTDGYEALYRAVAEPGRHGQVDDVVSVGVTRLDASRTSEREAAARREAMPSGR